MKFFSLVNFSESSKTFNVVFYRYNPLSFSIPTISVYIIVTMTNISGIRRFGENTRVSVSISVIGGNRNV